MFVPLLFVAVLFCHQCAQPGVGDIRGANLSESVPLLQPAGDAVEINLVRQAVIDPVSLLEAGIRRHDQDIRDYRGVFTSQEARDGKLNAPAVTEFKFRADPFSVTMQWVRGAGRIDRLLYADGRNDGNMVVHPSGLIGKLISTYEVDPHGEKARKTALRPITAFGMRNAARRVIEAFNKSLTEFASRPEYMGLADLDGRRVLTLENRDPNGRLVVDVDVETLLPIRIQEYGRDGELTSFYQYQDLEFNTGLDDLAFSRQVNGFSN